MHTIVTRDTFTAYETVGTMGVVESPDFAAQTIEQPRNHDIPDHSCLPTGTYELVPHLSGHLHETDGTPLKTWALVNPALGVTHAAGDPIPADCPFPHRCEALVHPDNVAATLLGCIGPGETREQIEGGGWMVTSSRAAFGKWRSILGAGTLGHTLEIREVPA
jgi:hypothetical protein